MTRRRLIAGIVTGAALLVPAGAAQAATCAPAGAAGGEWPFYSGQLDGSRTQPGENTIGTANAGQLGVTWKRTTPDGGVIHSTPVVVDGCVFFGTEFGNVYAVNADTGDVVWERAVVETDGSGIAQGAGIVGSPAVLDGRVIVPATTAATNGGAELFALDQATGAQLWKATLDTDPGSGLDSSPVPFNGMIFQAFKGDESSNHSNPGFAIVDASTGAILQRRNIIPTAHYDEGFRGGSIIGTPTVDLARGLIFAGTGNPASSKQHSRTNSLLKIDADPASPTFGDILASVRSHSDSYPAPMDVETPVCSSEEQWPIGRLSCAQFDLNMLASQNLFENSDGRQLFGGLGKSGMYTAIYTDTMELAWQTKVGVPCLACNLSSTATDSDSVFVAVTGGNLYSLDQDTGLPQWAVPLTGTFRYNGVAVANGVVYSLNDAVGTLQAFRADTGVPLLTKAFSQETRSPMHDMGNSSGVSVARNTVFATSQWENASTLFALKLGAGGGSGGGLPPTPTPPPLPGAPSGGRVVSGPGAATVGFATPVVTIAKGGNLNYTNGDVARHNVVSTQGLFGSPLIGTGQTTPVAGVQTLAPGSYPFICQPHPNMRGTLIVR